ncbi:uncharacterized protein PHACADRAFT_262433 [Phanerochaete carnosa HHB-10118-sp]|uniref:histone acetyltransferase n=1 Tax=Phanerochaete carnosa (strain HHB-10118-sp) TaxID=650164 RepID=K5WNT8_PHACS|nr:uncharacterized protein PHACADRAFT_262433 [Phanerochaete carnosa HHB-10118-sp]EKM51987.1 hypothetical protein PHACADRAFT_262433 [Phanerochaete carnosa HHB-10118-sp]
MYVSKVDSTGQGMFPSPTSTLVKALLSYYADTDTRPIRVDTLWIQLFARAQNQYLFPNSSEHPGKKPLSDVKLCAWWRRVLGEVAAELDAKEPDATLRAYYVLPGYSELEAVNSLHIVSPLNSSASPIQWTYGHPYSQSDIPLPYPRSQGPHNLGHYVPSFEDDPKSRFMDEIAHTTEGGAIRSPERKRARTLSRTDSKEQDTVAQDDSAKEHKEHKEHKPEGELGKCSANEFWERMSFRQECVAGAVTGFFTVGISSPSSTSHSHSTPSPLAPQPGQVAPNLVRRVVATLLHGVEFSNAERAAKSTETLEASIKGLCENVAASSPAETSRSPSSLAPLLFRRDSTPEPAPANVTLEVPRTPPPKYDGALPDISPNPFPEPTASLDTYRSHIYGSVTVSNPPLVPRAVDAVGADGAPGAAAAQPVTMLAVRKKKRKADAA